MRRVVPIRARGPGGVWEYEGDHLEYDRWGAKAEAQDLRLSLQSGGGELRGSREASQSSVAMPIPGLSLGIEYG